MTARRHAGGLLCRARWRSCFDGCPGRSARGFLLRRGTTVSSSGAPHFSRHGFRSSSARRHEVSSLCSARLRGPSAGESRFVPWTVDRRRSTRREGREGREGRGGARDALRRRTSRSDPCPPASSHPHATTLFAGSCSRRNGSSDRPEGCLVSSPPSISQEHLRGTISAGGFAGSCRHRPAAPR